MSRNPASAAFKRARLFIETSPETWNQENSPPGYFTCAKVNEWLTQTVLNELGKFKAFNGEKVQATHAKC